jgi:hypothetical protein
MEVVEHRWMQGRSEGEEGGALQAARADMGGCIKCRCSHLAESKVNELQALCAGLNHAVLGLDVPAAAEAAVAGT